MAAFGDLECALNDVLLTLSTFGFSQSAERTKGSDSATCVLGDICWLYFQLALERA